MTERVQIPIITEKKLIFLVMADDAWHEDIWLRWAQMRPDIHFIVHYWKATQRKNDTSMVTYYHQAVFNEWDHLIDLQFFLLHRALLHAQFQHCAFISGKCVPISPLENVLISLIVNQNQSMLQTEEIDPELIVRYKKPRKRAYTETHMTHTREIENEKWYEGPNWFILCYDHVQYLLSAKEYVSSELHKKWVYLPCYYDVAFVTFHADFDDAKGTHPPNIDEYGICTILAREFMDNIVDTAVTDYVEQSAIAHPYEFTQSIRDQLFFWRFVNNREFPDSFEDGKNKILSVYFQTFLSDQAIPNEEFFPEENWIWNNEDEWEYRFFARKLCHNPPEAMVAVLSERWKEGKPKPSTSKQAPHEGTHVSACLHGRRADTNEGANEGINVLTPRRRTDVTRSTSYGKVFQHMQYPASHPKCFEHQQRSLQIQQAISRLHQDYK